MAITKSWSLLDYCKANGKPMLTQPKVFTNTDTGEEFTSRSLAFVSPTEKDENGNPKVNSYVNFGRNLGILSPSEISKQFADLQVVETDDNKHFLCHKGMAAWEEVVIPGI